MMKKVLLIALVLMFAAPLRAAEQIEQFHADIAVQADGSIVVAETIRVKAEGDEIKRGIFRDLPTKGVGPMRLPIDKTIEVISIDRDGKAEPYHTTKQFNHDLRVYIGDKGKHLPTGVYTYKLRYRAADQVRSFNDHDEVYWNVTGNGWAFANLETSATITLPQDVNAADVRVTGYTGKRGSREQAVEATINDGGAGQFKTTRSLRAKEGLTIAYAFPKGIVDAKPISLGEAMAQNPPVMVGLVGLMAVLVFVVLTWVVVGRDPHRGVIIPLFEPPQDISPAAARYITQMGYDDRCFCVVLISMAVKGLIEITARKTGDYLVERTGMASKKANLSKGETQVYSALLGDKRRSLVLTQSNHRRIKKAVDGLKEKLEDEYHGAMFHANSKYMIVCVVLSLVMVIASAMMHEGERIAILFISIWLTGWSFGVYAIVASAIACYRRRKLGAAIASSLFAIPFIAAEVFGLTFFIAATSWWLVGLLIVLAALNYFYYRLIKAPTLHGREMMDDIDGFRMYLITAEGDEHAHAKPPERTMALFERYLPYAIALGVENRWAQQFEAVIAAAQKVDSARTVDWYHGLPDHAASLGDMTSSLSNSLSAAAASATAPSSSSSGFSSGGGGGGGFSGGGGGGGGGGGW